MDEKFLELVPNIWDNAADSSVEQAAGDPGPCLQHTTVQHIAKSAADHSSCLQFNTLPSLDRARPRLQTRVGGRSGSNVHFVENIFLWGFQLCIHTCALPGTATFL